MKDLCLEIDENEIRIKEGGTLVVSFSRQDCNFPAALAVLLTNADDAGLLSITETCNYICTCFSNTDSNKRQIDFEVTDKILKVLERIADKLDNGVISIYCEN